MTPKLRSTVVFHRAALGDFILIWPMLRELGECTVVTDGDKGRLAQRFLPDVQAIDIEQPHWNALWRTEHSDAAPADAGVSRVISFIAPDDSSWAVNARRRFPGARFEFRPTRPPVHAPERTLAADVDRGTDLLVHVGAGSPAKRCDLTEYLTWCRELADRGLTLRLLAGEVEREQWTESEREAFVGAGGIFVRDLGQLGDELTRDVGWYVGFDSGPTHLAAFLGLPTLAIFGPTDPLVWAPRGVAVQVLAPEVPTELSWLQPRRWLDAVEALVDAYPVASTMR